MNESDNILICQNLHKDFIDGKRIVKVLKGVNLTINRGERVAILGPSGSGKSTLLHLLGGLDRATQGEVILNHENLAQLTEKQRCALRNHALGFVYQFHHLLPEFSALENVAMPLLIRGEQSNVAKEKAREILIEVGLGERTSHTPGQLSGGERQRTAVARALVTNPLCILADEPTGNLDQHTAEHIYEVMLEINKRLNTSLLIVTHDVHLAKKMDRLLSLEDGILSEGK
ncbi:MAG: lipoprotein-releasing ABC transporter ATP-binding protein LolD [Gammaproteobacteria bacterium]